jgi:hypothetical protein
MLDETFPIPFIKNMSVLISERKMDAEATGINFFKKDGMVSSRRKDC